MPPQIAKERARSPKVDASTVVLGQYAAPFCPREPQISKITPITAVLGLMCGPKLHKSGPNPLGPICRPEMQKSTQDLPNYSQHRCAGTSMPPKIAQERARSPKVDASTAVLDQCAAPFCPRAPQIPKLLPSPRCWDQHAIPNRAREPQISKITTITAALG